jgi:D-lactate dehydrogenase
MKTYFFESTPEDQELLNQILPGFNLSATDSVFIPEKLNSDNAAQFTDAEIISTFIHSRVDQKTIDSLPNLKFIETRSTGFNHIDTTYAATKNITVSNVPAYGSRTVAEFTFALMLGLTRKTFTAFQQVKNNKNFNLEGLEGSNLQGKTLGIIGTGRIGLNVAQIAKGFDMNILAFDAFPNTAKATEIGFEYKSLDEVLAESDIVTLHTPYNKDTHHLINSDNIRKFKKGSILINTARGEITETEALLTALNEGILSAIGTDVVENENQVFAGQPGPSLDLITHPQVAYTPHLAFFTKEAKQEVIQTSVENISNFLTGEPKNKVN